MVKLDKTRRDLFIMDFVQFVSSPQTSARRLRKWNATVKQCPDNLLDEEWMRLWRGVYYIVWYEEMRKGGEEFITLIAEWDNPGFILSGFKSMAEFWGGIDAFRIDKYMFLARKMLANLFRNLASNGEQAFEDQQILVDFKRSQKNDVNEKITTLIEQYSVNVLDFIATSATKSIGFSIHLMDLYVDELQRNVPDISKQCAFMIPFLKRLALVSDDRVRAALQTKIFEKFMNTVTRESDFVVYEPFFTKLPVIASDIASITTKSKNRFALYGLAESCREHLDKARKAHEGRIQLKRRPTGFNRMKKKFRYETTTPFMFPRSSVPLPLEK